MDLVTIVLILAVVGGLLMAFSIGANDAANAMASSVGSRAITVKQAVLIASTLAFAGAVFLGANVAATISRGIINPEMIPDQNILMLGMLAALLSAGLWVLLATLFGFPVSTTHSIVGSILGFGFVAGGPEVVRWGTMVGIVLSWIISPFFGALLAYLVFSHIRKKVLSARDFVRNAKLWAPFWLAMTVVLVMTSFLLKMPMGKALGISVYAIFGFACVVAAVVWGVGYLVVGRLLHGVEQGPESMEELFRRMQIGMACYMALSLGANDVANAIGPVAAIWVIARTGGLAATAEVPLWLLLFGGMGIAVGVMVLGKRVMSTVGERITLLTNTRGFSVGFGAATTVLMASNLGMPVSTTHATVGGVVGVGLARGFAAVDFRVLGKIVMYWLLTVPIAAFTSIVIFQLLRWSVY
ncbi:inorganic phosphate transporter [Desulfonatronum lacustre]|uniref:inorganic phosphate transporter n=1 Tax=Desulfonatronum lacustre TaxID=66849 RepID=UPI00048DDA88|nr:inorganic phosphate transporter [Desulfonatronum lacustre]SMP66205.1 inorganic phosphate transporter, PiT family [Desulfonatronum zhilinae]